MKWGGDGGWRGSWLLAVSAYNTTGTLVEKTNRTIELQVTAPSPATALPTVVASAAPASTPAPAEVPGFGVVSVLVGLLVMVALWRECVGEVVAAGEVDCEFL